MRTQQADAPPNPPSRRPLPKKRPLARPAQQTTETADHQHNGARSSGSGGRSSGDRDVDGGDSDNNGGDSNDNNNNNEDGDEGGFNNGRDNEAGFDNSGDDETNFDDDDDEPCSGSGSDHGIAGGNNSIRSARTLGWNKHEPERPGQDQRQGKLWGHCFIICYSREPGNSRRVSIEVIDDDEDDSNDNDNKLLVPFDIPVGGVNHLVEFPLSISWDDFEWEVSSKLKALPSNVSLSYKLASQTKGEMQRALTDERDFKNLMQRCTPFVNGLRKCGRGKEFRVQLFPKITAGKDAPASTQTQEV